MASLGVFFSCAGSSFRFDQINGSCNKIQNLIRTLKATTEHVWLWMGLFKYWISERRLECAVPEVLIVHVT